MAPIKYSIEYMDYCSGCDTKIVIACCDKCGDAVCNSSECCTKYERYKNENIILCKFCIHIIENKFKLLKEPEPVKYTGISKYR